MKIDLSQFRETFLQESAEHVASMEDGLLALRSAPDDVELMHAIFRSAHSIKGGAGTFALTGLVRFTHVLENLLDRLRAMEMPVTDAVIALLLQSVDGLRGLLAAGADGEPPAMIAELHERLEALLTSAPQASQAEPNPASESLAPPAVQPPASIPVEARYRVCFHPSPEIFRSGSNPLLLVRNLAMLGTVASCLLDSSALPPLEELDPARSYLRWEIELSTACEEAEIREVFEFVEHLASVQIERLPQTATAGASAPEHVPAPVSAQLSSFTVSSAPPPQPAESAAPPRPGARRAARPDTESATIRVATDKVDRLIDLMGELVIANGMAEQMVEHFTPACLPQLREAVAAMERSTRELHERVMSIRMLPVGSLFQRYTRTVYDIAQTTGKQIALELSGEDTELDKSMLDLLADPLTHLIRNAADHGIEAPAARAAAGKTEQGTIRLRAQHRSGRIVIEIADDGAGIDLARVRAKAVERGMIAPDAQLSDDQIRMLIFEAGFSTRDQVSDLSGRGVGMDVVKRNIERLNGSISLHSQSGLGSRVALELPLTLAIVEGLLVRVGDRTLVLPLLEVVETVSPVPGQIVSLAGRGEAIMIHGESVAVLRLHRFLGIATDCDAGLAEARCLVVVVEAGQRKIGLVIDEILGQQQVVLKSLERHLHKVDGLMGATILGDGCVAPILDVAALAKLPLYAREIHHLPIPSGPVIAAMDAAAQPQPAVLSG
jgi:two-component system chemotaxis sensor kinase CheA